LLALRSKQRIVIQNGGIAQILATSAEEKRNLKKQEELEAVMLNVRDDLRNGKQINSVLGRNGHNQITSPMNNAEFLW